MAKIPAKLTPYLPGIILLIISIIAGILVYQDYGVSWDEPEQRELGIMSYDYATKGDTTINTNEDRRLGTGFELPLIFIERKLHLQDSRDVYLSRHIATHLFFLLSAFCMYVLAYRLFGSRLIGCMGFVMLAFHPRLYAHSFFNSKDLPFLSAFLIALLLCQLAFSKNRPIWYLLLGMACAYATSIRAMGIILVPAIGIFFLIDLFNNAGRRKAATGLLAFSLSFCGMLCLSWPYLWHTPVHNFIDAFSSLANIKWTGQVNFMGHFYDGDKLPYSYMPVWFGITVPEVWLLAGLCGLILIVINIIRKPGRYFTNTPERNYGLYLATFSLPVIAIIAMHGVNIDDWRHLYFIYPSFVLLGLYTINKLLQGKMKWPVIALSGAQLLLVGIFMTGNHPFQQVYFNNLVSHKEEYLRKNYDLEYWGAAYKQALEHLVTTEPADSIKLQWVIYDYPLMNNIKILPKRDRDRIERVQTGADYFITNYRLHPADYPYPQTAYSIKALNSTILCVYKTH